MTSPYLWTGASSGMSCSATLCPAAMSSTAGVVPSAISMGVPPRHISEEQSYVVQAGTGHQRPDGCHWSRLHWITNFTVHVIDRMTPMPPGGHGLYGGRRRMSTTTYLRPEW